MNEFITIYYGEEAYTISKARSNLLRANKGRVRACHIIGAGYSAPCFYQYADGFICAASAALSDLERYHISRDELRTRLLKPDNLNSCSVCTLHKHWGFFDPTEVEPLQMLQDMHDHVLREGSGSEDFHEFYNTLAGIIQ